MDALREHLPLPPAALVVPAPLILLRNECLPVHAVAQCFPRALLANAAAQAISRHPPLSLESSLFGSRAQVRPAMVSSYA